MKIAFRVDASLDIGTGHVMRCLSLADALRAQGSCCHFICREGSGNLIAQIEERGYKVHRIASKPVALSPSPQASTISRLNSINGFQDEDIEGSKRAIDGLRLDWLVVDHYALDYCWERAMRPQCRRLMAIDDLADRFHECDLLLDQNLGRVSENYDDWLLKKSCRRLIGPRYALLRSEFPRLREQSLERRRRPALQKLLISMGGVDQENATGKVLTSLRPWDLPEDCRMTVVLGRYAPWREAISNLVHRLRWSVEVLIDVHNMAELMVSSDLAIGAAGTTSWERCCLGLPAALVILAENQRNGALALEEAGAAVLIGEMDDIRDNIGSALARAGSSLGKMVTKSSGICAGDGAYLVAREMDI